MTPKPQLVTPGEMLAAARKDAGLSLIELEERTKVPRQTLAAIEQDEYHKVSGELYVKSFLRSYAGEVGLDPAEVLQLYNQFSGASVGGGSASEADVWTEEVRITRIGVPWGRIAAAVVAVALVVVLAVMLWPDGQPGDSVPANSGANAEVTEPDPTTSMPDEAAETAAKPTDDAPATSAAAEETPTATTPPPPTRTSLPAVPRDAAITFADGQTWPLILRLICRAPQTVGAKCDADRQFRDAVWPRSEAAAEALNTASVAVGKAYAVREGYVVYWGARDHFSLRLSDVGAATVTLNGVRQDLTGLRPGQELLLDATAGGR